MTEGVTWKEVLMPANRKRLAIIITLQIGVCEFCDTRDVRWRSDVD